MNRGKSAISTWVPNKEDMLITNDGKLLIILFEKAINPKDIDDIGEGETEESVHNKVSQYDTFIIKKLSYEKRLPEISHYLNFFIKYYDADNELITAYFKLKYELDKERRFNADNQQQLIDLIYEVLFTDTIVDKIKRLVNDNYLDDIESDVDNKYTSERKKHLESLEFTNQHVKIMLAISVGMKIISPVLFHYVAINMIKLDKDTELIYEFYKGLFDLFSTEINIYNKLFVYVEKALAYIKPL